MAVKNYGWYHVINPKPAMVPYGADCQNSTYCQVYNPYISYSSTDQAIGAMSTTGWYQNGAIFESGYCGGGASSGTSVSACGYEVNKMSQYGSNLWANSPYNESYSQMLSYYYSASGTISYFTYLPNPPLIYVANSDTSTITFNYSSASSVNYEIWKWVNNSWMLQYGPGTATSWTDSLLTGGTAYTYAAYAQSPDGTWWSGAYPNGGYITAVAGVPSSLKSPITDAFFMATSTVRISATSTTANIDEWALDKYSTTSGWFSVYSGWPDAVSATSGDATSTNPFPKPAYRDFTRWEGSKGGDGRFVYVDTGLTANTQNYYTVAYHTSSGWSDWSNHNGSVDPFTDQSN